jgi:hypothetical protein
VPDYSKLPNINEMKALKLSSLIILVLISLRSTAQYDSLFGVVSGDTVTFWQTIAWRNCSAVYRMEIEQDGYNLTWNQVDTADDLATCNCFFDLAVSFKVSTAGSYHADVYATPGLEPGNFIYQGFIEFTVGQCDGPARSEILGQYQSECYHDFGLSEENLSSTTFNLYPNPLKDADVLNFEAFSTGMTILEIFTLTGKQIYSRQYDGNRQIRDSFIKDGLFPAPGIYIVRLRNDDQVFVRKITVL